jgi:hypothetical protein
MAYEVYEKVVKRTTSPTMSISKLGRISFNAASTETLRKNAIEYVLLLWDKDTRKIAVKSTSKKDARCYVLRFTQKNRMSGFAAKTFLNHIEYDFTESHQYPCSWNDREDMFEVQLPAERFGVVVHPKRTPRIVERGSSGSRTGGMRTATA